MQFQIRQVSELVVANTLHYTVLFFFFFLSPLGLCTLLSISVLISLLLGAKPLNCLFSLVFICLIDSIQSGTGQPEIYHTIKEKEDH